jgi:hypothetical protein
MVFVMAAAIVGYGAWLGRKDDVAKKKDSRNLRKTA